MAAGKIIKSIHCRGHAAWQGEAIGGDDASAVPEKDRHDGPFTAWHWQTKQLPGPAALFQLFTTIDPLITSEVSYRLGSDQVHVNIREAGRWKEYAGLTTDYLHYRAVKNLLLAGIGAELHPGMPCGGALEFEIINADGSRELHPARISCLPSFGDWCLSIRFIRTENQMPPLEASAISSGVPSLKPVILQPGVARLVRQAMLGGGLILITGPTGQGKTTTGYSMLRELATRGNARRNVITLEDPVESRLSFAMQMEVGHRHFDVTEGLRTAFRHDPDVIYIGEIRTAAGAEAAVQAASAGHLCVATLHADSVWSALQRLDGFGIDPALLAAELACVLNQRLERQLCIGCARELPAGPDTTLVRQEVLRNCELAPGDAPLLKSRNARGCAACEEGELKQRLAVFELLRPDDALRHWLVSPGASRPVLSSSCHRSFRQGMAEMAARGLLDPMQLAKYDRA